MPSPAWVRAVVAIAAMSWFLIAMLMDVRINEFWTKPLGFATSATVLIVLAFDRYVWFWLPARVVRYPRLRGTWRAELVFHGGQGPVEKRDAYVVIRQTFSQISVVMLLESSRSVSSTAKIRKVDGRHQLSYVYWSGASVLNREGNPPHRGAADLIVRNSPGVGFEGDYWTDRRTVGRIVSQGHSSAIFDDFANAAAATYR